MVKKFVATFAASLLFFSCVSLHAEETNDETETEQSRWLVIHAGSLLAVPGQSPITERTIVVRDGRIADLLDGYVDAAGAVGDPEQTDIEVLDLKNAFVLPGLMDMHVHLSAEFDVDGQRSYGSSDPYVKQHSSAKDDVYNLVTGIENARKTLQAGFTTVRNVGSEGWHIFALRDGIRDGRIEGPRILASGHTIRVGADDGSGACFSVESCRRETRAQIDMGADLIKIQATCSGSKPCGHKDAPPVFLTDEVKAIVEVAHSRELTVAAHAHGTDGINLAASLGVSSIDHGSYNDKESRSIMRQGNVYLVPTLSVQDRIKEDIKEATGSMLDVMQGFLDNHGPRMLASHKAGVKIAAGSDAGVAPHGNNARELELYVEHGLGAEEAIVAATVNAADLIGKADEVGTIEVGKIADVIAVDGNPLDDISVLMNVAVVIKDGRVVKNKL